MACPYGVHNKRGQRCTCGMRKGSGNTDRTQVRTPKARQKASNYRPGATSASARKADGCAMTIGVPVFGAVLIALMFRKGRR